MKLLMFPGQGSQYPGMAKDWFQNFKEAKLVFEEASDYTGLDLKKLCFEGSESDLRQTALTQPAILTSTVAIFRCLQHEQEIDFEKCLFAGHSLGEYSALCSLGAISVGPAARLVNKRGTFMQEAVPAGTGGMAAIVFRPKTDGSQKALELCQRVQSETGKKLEVANFNSPEQIVVSGEAEAVAKAVEWGPQAPVEARKVVELPVSAPFHSSLMQSAADQMADELGRIEWLAVPKARYIANVDAKIYSLEDIQALAARLKAQITSSVQWVKSVETAITNACTEAIEIGPGRVLSGLVKRINVEGKGLDVKNIERVEDYKNERIEI